MSKKAAGNPSIPTANKPKPKQATKPSADTPLAPLPALVLRKAAESDDDDDESLPDLIDTDKGPRTTSAAPASTAPPKKDAQPKSAAAQPASQPPAKPVAAAAASATKPVTTSTTVAASNGTPQKAKTVPPPPTSTDPTAWNLATPIPEDLDEQDEFPEILMPLIDFTKLLPGQPLPKPEFRQDVVDRMQQAMKQNEQHSAGNGAATKSGVKTTPAGPSQASSKVIPTPAQQQVTTNKTPSKAKSNDDDYDVEMPELFPARCSCDVTVTKGGDMRHIFELVGDMYFKTGKGNSCHFLTADRDSPERCMISMTNNVSVKESGIFNLNQRTANGILRAMEVHMPQGGGLEFHLEGSIGDGSGPTLEVLNATTHQKIFVGESKVPKSSSEVANLFVIFQARSTETLVTVSFRKAMRLLTSLSHLSQFGSLVDITLVQGGKEIQLNVNGALWSLPVDTFEVRLKDSEVSVKNLPIARMLHVLYQARRLGDDAFQCSLELPGVFLTCRSGVTIKALIKEERKKKS